MFDCPGRVLEEVRNGFSGRHIVVVGDLMLDRYLWGQVERISPEAPVPVLKFQRETVAAGGAANVARNLAALGLSVTMVGVTGEDPARDRLLEALAGDRIDTDDVLAAPARATSVKTRVIGNHQQLVRIDEETTARLDTETEDLLLAKVGARLHSAHALVLSDYAKGVLTGGLCPMLIQAARERSVPVLIDPKGHDFSRYAGATAITPNRCELGLATGAAPEDLSALLAAGEALRSDLKIRALVATLGDQGMVIIDEWGPKQIPAVAREVFDVSGAGDTVIATFAAGVAAGLGHVDTAHLANLAAGIVVGKVGTNPVTTKELLSAMAEESVHEQATKICETEELRQRVRAWQARGERVVFTNGCFDLLHAGHVTYLEQARRFGHRLVVGVNTDRSVRVIKGPARPLIGEDQRVRVLAALASVDAVILFDEETPLALIRQIRPDVLAKGADYAEEQIIGAAEIKSWGGRVVRIPLVKNTSTTGILERIR